MIFHAKCARLWAEEKKNTGKGTWGGQYDKSADVQPSYYRTADNCGQARMESGSEYKGGANGGDAPQ